MVDSNPYQSTVSDDKVLEITDHDGLQQQPSGIGGWLILLAIGMVLSPLRIGATFFLNFLPIFQDGTWESLTTPGSENYHVLWAPLMIFEVVGNLAFIIAYTALAFLFFRKSRFFPKTYIVMAFANLCFLFLDTWFVSLVVPDAQLLDPETAKEVARSLVSVFIWVPYMLVSKRVKNTFVL